MNCENEYCIYNNDLMCCVENISIDSIGICNACIMVSFEKEFLDKQKEKQREEIESRYRNEK
jgi:hypothetical protein